MEQSENHRAYCRRRAAEERIAAEHAADERAAEVHFSLARHFEERAEQSSEVADSAHSFQPTGTLCGEFRIIG
jgi:hypothetical protein